MPADTVQFIRSLKVEQKQTFLQAIDLPADERSKVLKELDLKVSMPGHYSPAWTEHVIY
jgi:hypothetical protein